MFVCQIELGTEDEGREEVWWQGKLETRVLESLGRFLRLAIGHFSSFAKCRKRCQVPSWQNPGTCLLKMEEERSFPDLQKSIQLLERNFAILGFCPRISLTPLTPATCYK